MKELHSDWIIFFGEDWHGHNSTAQYLAKELQNQYKILWVNSIGLREPRLTIRDLNRVFKKVYLFIKDRLRLNKNNAISINTSHPNIFIENPIAIPYLRFKIVRKINYIIIKKLLVGASQRYGINNAIIISANPATADIMDIITPTVKVYYCADEYTGMPFVNANTIKKLETDLLRNCDLVIATNIKLQKMKAKFHSNVKYLPHGVCYEPIKSALLNKKRPYDIKEYSAPVIGFVGSIGEHIELNYIEYAAKKLPKTKFVMVGPIFDGIKPSKLDNVIYLGNRDYKIIPDYLTAFDITLMPFVESKRILYAHPTKIREYISAGCITIATPHDELINLSDSIKFASSKEMFLEKIKLALSEITYINRIKISETMIEHDWKYRAAELKNFITQTQNAA